MYEKHFVVSITIHDLVQEYAFTNRVEVLKFITEMKYIFERDVTNVSIEEKLVKLRESVWTLELAVK